MTPYEELITKQDSWYQAWLQDGYDSPAFEVYVEAVWKYVGMDEDICDGVLRLRDEHLMELVREISR